MVSHTSGGAIAVWSPTGLSINSKATLLGEEFFRAVFVDGEEKLGDAVLKALDVYTKRTGDTLMTGIYNLLGDPALQLKKEPPIPGIL